LAAAMSIVTIFLQAHGYYEDGNWSPYMGYLYITLIYNTSISIALYALFLFYFATRDLLRPFDPVIKFFTIKSVIFLSFWQGVTLAVLERLTIVEDLIDSKGTTETHSGTVAAGFQNFLICVEMFVASIAMRYAFPISVYNNEGCGNHDGSGRNVTMQSISSTLRETMNPRDIMTDAIHNFHPQYQQYTQYSSDNKRFQNKPTQGGAADGQLNTSATATGPENGVVLSAAPRDNVLVDTSDIPTKNTVSQPANQSGKAKNNEKSLLLLDDE